MVSAKGDLKNADLLMKGKSNFQILTGILQKIKFLVVTGMPKKNLKPEKLNLWKKKKFPWPAVGFTRR